MTVAVIGLGWVGKFMQTLFPSAYVYTDKIGTREEVNKQDVAFVCVPTPNPSKGKLDTSIVEECISWIECPLIVVRSTVNPGDCDRWAKKYNKCIVMQPEYLGETPGHPMLDPKTRQFMILGGDRAGNRQLIELYQQAYSANINIRQVTRLEAEVIKLGENRAIAHRLGEYQELYDVCEAAGLDYYTIRDAIYGDDPRFNLWWTFVDPKKRGFVSKCLPKDVYAWMAWAESLGYEPKITKAILERNEEWLKL